MEATWIWQQLEWPRFRWDQARLQRLLHQAHQAREHLLEQLNALEEAMAALLGRESLCTAAIEGEQLDPGQVRSTTAGRPAQGGRPQQR